MSDQLQTTDAPTDAPATEAPAHGVVLTGVAAERSSPCSPRKGATTCVCGSACSPAAARA